MTDHTRQLISAAAILQMFDRDREAARQRLIREICAAADPGGLTVAQIALYSGYSRQHIHRLLAEPPTP